jgi:hypothetical protein
MPCAIPGARMHTPVPVTRRRRAWRQRMRSTASLPLAAARRLGLRKRSRFGPTPPDRPADHLFRLRNDRHRRPDDRRCEADDARPESAARGYCL